MIELAILRLFCQDKASYTKYNKSFPVAYIKTNFKALYKLYTVINLLYSKTDVAAISAVELEAKYLEFFPVLKDLDRKELIELIQRIFASPIPESVPTMMESHRLRAAAGEIAILALAVNEGKPPEALQKALAAFETVDAGVDGPEFVSDDLEALYTTVIAVGGIHWPLPCLNESIGPLRKGNFVVVFARPETGKTTFMAQFATNAVSQVDRPILWFNNEQAGGEVKLRFYQAMFGVTTKELMADRAKYHALYKEKTKDLLFLYDSDILFRETIETLCKEYNPSLVIIDQLDKIEGGPKEDRRDLVLGNTYVWARSLAKRYCPVVGISQASDSGEGVKYLTYSHLADSRTAKPAEADVILGIGLSRDDDFQLYRYFNISKNKLLGDELTKAELRHGKFQVILMPEIARYQEV
jgi:replicative DNA helicase